MDDHNALQLLELLGEYARDHGADCAPEMTVRELAGDLFESLPDRYTGPSVDKARASIAGVFGRTEEAFPVGARVQLSPATDDWMRGDRFGVVVGAGQTRGGIATVRVKLDRSGRTRTYSTSHVESA